jgi:hypothetical protein
MEYSCLKILAGKHKISVAKMKEQFRAGKSWGIPYETKSGSKICYFGNYRKCKSGKCSDIMPNMATAVRNDKNTIESRLKANKCGLCGIENLLLK